MWFGILFTVLVEIFPLPLRSTAIALFIFVINNVGSNGQLLVPILRPRFGFRRTLYFTYAGFYGLSKCLVVSLCSVACLHLFVFYVHFTGFAFFCFFLIFTQIYVIKSFSSL